MRRIIIGFILLFTTQLTLNAQYFEGTIEYQVKILGQEASMIKGMFPEKMEYKFRDGDTRMNIVGGLMPQDMLIKTKENIIWILQPAAKKALRLKVDDEKNNKINQPKVTPTDEFKDIVGYRCQKYKLILLPEESKSKGIEATFWVTNELKVKNPKVKNNKLFVDGLEGFPLEVDMELGMQNLRMQMLANLVDTTPPSADEFIIPANYTKEDFSISELGKPGK